MSEFSRRAASAAAMAALLLGEPAATAHAQTTQVSRSEAETVVVTGRAQDGYAASPDFRPPKADLGPLGTASVLDTPQSVTIVPEDLIVNLQTRNVNDTLRFLPSVEIRDQQGFEVSRPQSRGFQSSIASNTRLDGLNVIGTTAIAAENLAGIEVLDGPAGALFGPEAPSGVFDYILKRPTDTPLFRYVQGFQSNGEWTEWADVGGRFGPHNMIGLRLNAVHGQGESYVEGSNTNCTLASLDADLHLDANTVVEADYSHYETQAYGLPGSIVYDTSVSGAKGNTSSLLPKAADPTTLGLGQPDAGTDLRTETALGKIKHRFNADWSLEVGGLYQNAIRGLFGVTNTLTNNVGDYSVTKNFTAVPEFTIGSNSAYLNGHVRLLGLLNDINVGTNGFINGQYSHVTTAAFTPVIGKANLANPIVFPTTPIVGIGRLYEANHTFEQSIILGDTLHLTDEIAVQAVVNTSFLHTYTFSANGQRTADEKSDGVASPTVSLLYKPLPDLTLHATWAESIEQGDESAANNSNPLSFLGPYHDKEAEVGAKYQATPALLLTLDAFSMTRPYATTPSGSSVFQVVGEQQNNGLEAFAQGEITPELSLFGGLTFIDARLLGSDNVTTNDKRIVGVPRVKSDLVFDYHPRILPGAAATLAITYESNRAATDANNSFAPAFATIDPGVRYGFEYGRHHVTARFQVINATNTRYYVSIADGTIVGSPNADTAYLGTPRTYAASLDLDF